VAFVVFLVGARYVAGRPVEEEAPPPEFSTA
jgi:hypothetical protein